MSRRVYKRPLKGHARDSRQRKMVLDVDLNDVPPGESRAQERTTTSHNNEQSASGRLYSAPIDVEAFDDDVMISSPRRFMEARNNARRNQVVVLDEDSNIRQNQSEDSITRLTLNSFNNHGRNTANGTVINCELYHSSKRKRIVIPSKEPPPPQSMAPKEPIFSCAICMGPLVEETSTSCGHIFCMKCIKAAIAAQKKCPTCRHKLTNSSIHRVYLPTTS